MWARNIGEALRSSAAPPSDLNTLALIEVPYRSLDGSTQTGQLVVHRLLAAEVGRLFKHIAMSGFPIAAIKLPTDYGWDDDRLMGANITSAFNYRLIAGTGQVSAHGLGRAIDINPLLNPSYGRTGVQPLGARYDPAVPGTLVADDPVVKLFEEAGWTWLGRRAEYPDYQHFEKRE